MSRKENKELAKTNLKTWTKPFKNYSISDLRPKNTYDQHCSILLAEFNMSTLLFLLIRSLQILRSSAYSFAVLCSPLWLMFVLYEFVGRRSFIDPVYCNSCMVLSMFFRLVLANSLFSLRDINLTSFFLIRSLQILRSSAYSFAVLCSPLWLMFVHHYHHHRRRRHHRHHHCCLREHGYHHSVYDFH